MLLKFTSRRNRIPENQLKYLLTIILFDVTALFDVYCIGFDATESCKNENINVVDADGFLLNVNFYIYTRKKNLPQPEYISPEYT